MNVNCNERLLQALKSFGDAVTGYRADNSVLPWAPMLPYVYPRYGENPYRLFYIGRDTYGWDLGSGGFSDFFERYDANDLSSYLKQNSSTLTTETRLNGWAGYTGSFWHVVNLLHLRLRLGRIPDLSKLSSDEVSLLDEVGYGNLNSIELSQTLQKQECWGDIDQAKYSLIKDASAQYLDRYDLLQNAFHPSVSFIMTWTGTEDEYFKNVNWERLADETEGKLKIAVYLVEKDDNKSLVIWTYHPSYLPRIQIGCSNFIERIAAVAEKYKSIFENIKGNA